MNTWDLEDSATYLPVLEFALPFAHTWGSKADRERRESIRCAAQPRIPNPIPPASWWAFRICITKTNPKGADADNFAKLIIDSFSAKQLRLDETKFPTVELFPDDDIPTVRVVQVTAQPGESDSALVQVFARRSSV